jgi:hypothetical protein
VSRSVFWRQARRFLSALFSETDTRRSTNPVESIVRTMENSTHVRGARMRLPRASTEAQHEIVVEGHERYVESLEDDD